MTRKRLVILVALALAGGSTAAASVEGSTSARQPTVARGHDPVTLKQALAVSRKLGPLAPSRSIHLVLGLRARDQGALDRAFASGRVQPGEYAPDARLVRRALGAARTAGFRAKWTAGDQIASVVGPVRLVESFFDVRLYLYVSPGGRRFFASDRAARIPRSLRPAVTAVTGLDDYAQASVAAIPRGGVTPNDVLSFYDIAPLRQAGFDGAGETVVFPELNSPADIGQLRRDLADYASRFKLPPFQLTVHSKSSWQPLPAGDSYAGPALGETALDLEIVHAIAPRAKLVIYLESRNLSVSVQAQTAMVTEQPAAIISDSTGFCESIVPSTAAAQVLQSPWVRQSSQNMTHYVASGDSGAYECGQDQPAAVAFTAAVPVNTAVGGTSVFLARNGGYYRELAWGNPLSQTGGGGGVSRFYSRPDFQRGAGVPPLSTQGRRLVPDVAALADMNTGWFIIAGGSDHQIGGTSAAAPLWAGITALINQKLVRSGLPRVGSANPALYWIAARQSRFHAFHDVRGGNNLLYSARAGWDEATGLGSPDVANLANAWAAYQREVKP
jgi:kumamolisin